MVNGVLTAKRTMGADPADVPSGASIGVGHCAGTRDRSQDGTARCLRSLSWQPYERAAREDTLLAAHADFLRERAPLVRYSARILHQELCSQRGFRGSYDVVKRFVAPLRALEIAAQATQTRFETPPGQQSQIGWGQARVQFRCGSRTMHILC